jgi:hypothetical protein
MDKDDFPQRFERSFVALVASRTELRGFRKGEFAGRLWPWMNPKVAGNRWAAMRDKAAHTGKPQNVTLADAQRMADVLAEDLGYLWAVAKENVKKEMRAAAGKEEQDDRAKRQ